MEINNLEDIEKYIPTEEAANKFLSELRWGKWAKCPYCGNPKAYFIENGKRYKCANKLCYKKFSVTVKTIFSDTKYPLLQWIKMIFSFTKTRGRITSFEFIELFGMTAKNEFFVREKLEFCFSKVERIGKSNYELLIETIKVFFNYYELYQEKKHSIYSTNPYHISDDDINDISDKRQYNILERYTRYYVKVYCTWIYFAFYDPPEILSETFLYMRDNNINEYNGSIMIKLIQKVVGILYEKTIAEKPHILQQRKQKQKLSKENGRINLSNGYVASLIKKTKIGAGMTIDEIKNNQPLMEETKKRIRLDRIKKGKNYEFISHFC